MTSSQTKKSRRRCAREYAVQAVYQWQLSQPSLQELLTQFVEENDFSGADRDYWSHLVTQIIQQCRELDALIEPCVTRVMTDINPVELAILRVAACELRFAPEIPYRVVINEAVELAKLFAATDSHRFVNAAIDKLAKSMARC